MNAITPNVARSFREAHAVDYEALKGIAESLKALRPQRDTDPGEVLHCLNGARQQLLCMDDGLDIGLCAQSLEGYIERLEAREKGVAMHLRPSPILKRLASSMPRVV